MRRSAALVALALGLACAAHAAEPAPNATVSVTVGREHARLTGPLRPDLRPKVQSAGRALLVKMAAQEEARKKDPRAPFLGIETLARKMVDDASRFGLTTQSNADIEALATLVLLEAAKDADEDVKSATSRLAAINALKRCSREPRCVRDVRPTAEIHQADLDALRDKLDSLGELGEIETLRLQAAMDRLSKLLSTLSNMLKKISDTSQQIVRNLK
jgi:hypothetical protein